MHKTNLCLIAGLALLATPAFAQTAPATPAPQATTPQATTTPATTTPATTTQTASQATAAQAATAQANAAATGYKTALVCRTMPHPPDSLIGGARVLLTQYEWDKQRQQAQKNLNDAQLRDRGATY